MKCVKCKKIIDSEDVFCGYCGIHQAKFKKYIERVSKKIHIKRDKNYKRNVKLAENKLKNLESAKQNEINRITKLRWQNCGSHNFSYNMIEGKIIVNDSIYVFSDIKGAEIVKESSYRVITTEKGTSKKHASLGGAVAGGLIFGPLGAVVGGSTLGKTNSTGNSASNSIPTCNHIGVNVNINGFTSEIILLSKTVDQSSIKYTSSLKIAQSIVDKLRKLSTIPVPKKFLKPEEEKTVLDFESQIAEADKELHEAISNKPNYNIPKSYYE